MDAHSDTTMDGRDVFGFVGPFVFFAEYKWDEATECVYAVAEVAADACPECGKSLSEFDGNCRWTECGGREG